MAKIVKFDAEARAAMIRGENILADNGPTVNTFRLQSLEKLLFCSFYIWFSFTISVQLNNCVRFIYSHSKETSGSVIFKTSAY